MIEERGRAQQHLGQSRKNMITSSLGRVMSPPAGFDKAGSGSPSSRAQASRTIATVLVSTARTLDVHLLTPRGLELKTAD